MNAKVLLVDDEPNILAALRRSLGNRFVVHCATTGAEALELVESQGPFAAIVSDMRMPEMSGLELLRKMRRRAPETVRLVLSGYADFDAVLAAVNDGAIFRFHTKPVSADVLIESIESALLRHQAERVSGGQIDPSEQLLQDVGELRRALGEGQLRFYLQPQFRLADGRVSGLEALVRWAHPARGLLLPGQFLGTAEAAGLVGDITAWMLDAACAQARAWSEQGLGSLRIAVNITAEDLAQAHFADRVRLALNRHGVAAHWLELELTEGAAVRDIEATRAILTELTELGVELSIDDFGTGYSSFAWLRRLPIGKLKIDRSFVQDIAEDAEARRIVEAIIGLAGDLHLDVVAEGIETETQLGLLKQAGCHIGQGFLFARPMPANEVAAWLAARQVVPT